MNGPKNPSTQSWKPAGFIIAASVLVAYWSTLHVPFLFDDLSSIENNASLRSFWTIDITHSPPADSGLAGRPFANLTFAISYAMSGLHPWGYHVVSLTVHLLAALLLYGVVRRTLLLPALREKFGADSYFLAVAVAVIWAVHPLQTQTVTYVSQRMESLMALFYLATVYCFIRGTERSAGRWQTLSVASCVLGALSKEVIVTAPFLVLLYDRTFVAGTFFGALRQRWRYYCGLASIWPLLAWLLVGVGTRGVGYGLGVSWFQYALTECKAIPLYLSLGVWPHPLIFDRGPLLIASAPAALPYALALVILIGATVAALRRWPAGGFAAACFFIILAPTSSVVPITQAPIAENRPYLPLAAVVVLVVVGARLATTTRTTRLLCIVFAAACMAATVLRNRDYQSGLSIWTDTVAKAPANPRAHNNLGFLLGSRAGGEANAISEFEAALRLDPNYADAHDNLARLLARHPERQAEALAHYETALRLKPDHAHAHNNLAVLLSTLPGRQTDAVAHYEAALRINPDFAEAHNNLATFLAGQAGHEPEALRHYAEALRLKPDSAEVHNNLANLLMSQPGRQTEALSHYEAALQLLPNSPDLHCNFANALAELPGRQADAIFHLHAALKLNPQYGPAREALQRLQSAP